MSDAREPERPDSTIDNVTATEKKETPSLTELVSSTSTMSPTSSTANLSPEDSSALGPTKISSLNILRRQRTGDEEESTSKPNLQVELPGTPNILKKKRLSITTRVRNERSLRSPLNKAPGSGPVTPTENLVIGSENSENSFTAGVGTDRQNWVKLVCMINNDPSVLQYKEFEFISDFLESYDKKSGELRKGPSRARSRSASRSYRRDSTQLSPVELRNLSGDTKYQNETGDILEEKNVKKRFYDGWRVKDAVNWVKGPLYSYLVTPYDVKSTTGHVRASIRNLVISPTFDHMILLIILINIVCLALNTPTLDPDSQLYSTLEHFNVFFILVYIIEALMKLIGLGLFADRINVGMDTDIVSVDGYFCDNWNVLDFFILISTWFAPGSSSFRMFRILRPLRTVQRIPGLKHIIDSLARSRHILISIFLVLLFVVSLFAILGKNTWLLLYMWLLGLLG